MSSLKLLETATDEEVRLLMKWRRKVQTLWGETFKVTYTGTRAWIDGITLDKNKAFFLIVKDNKYIGQIGFQWMTPSLNEIGYVIRGEGKPDGCMSDAMRFLIKLSCGKKIVLHVLKSNTHAVRFYEHLNFKVTRTIGGSYEMEYEDIR